MLWADVALSDMRKPGFVGAYIDSYAPNSATPTGRNAGGRNSSQASRANLVMGRYPTPVAFTGTNPDYAEVSWITNPTTTGALWTRALYWNQIYCADPWGISHTPGWINNTRVMSWDHQLWIKSKSTGQWTRYTLSDSLSGEAWSPNFSFYGGQSSSVDCRTESATGYQSIRLVYDSGEPTGVGYWIFHGYSGGIVSIDPYDVAEVLASQKTSLVVHDLFYADDRDYSRFLLACGADYYPATSLPVYPGVGTSRHKLVRAKWPNWQYHVMHTMTEAQFDYPSSFASLSEGDSTATTDPGSGEATPMPLVHPVSSWAALETGGSSSWGASAVGSAYESDGVPPVLLIRGRR